MSVILLCSCHQLSSAINLFLFYLDSRHAEKYVRRGRLDWPEGATSRESIKSVIKLPRLQVDQQLVFSFSTCFYSPESYIRSLGFAAEFSDAAC